MPKVRWPIEGSCEKRLPELECDLLSEIANSKQSARNGTFFLVRVFFLAWTLVTRRATLEAEFCGGACAASNELAKATVANRRDSRPHFAEPEEYWQRGVQSYHGRERATAMPRVSSGYFPETAQ